MRRSYLDLEHGQMHYRQAGDSASPALLLLHQAPSHSAMYEPLMQALEDDFFLLAPDTPGFGASDPLPGTVPSIEDYARAIHAFTVGLSINRFCLFGHHTGAAIAAALENLYPGSARRVALSGPTLLTDEQRANLPAAAALQAADASGSHLLDTWQRLRAKDPEVSTAITQRELISALGAGQAYRDAYQAVCEFDTAAALASLCCPVLVFAGDADPLYAAVEPALALLQDGHRAELSGGERTYVCERQAELVAALLRDFFV